MEYKFEKIVNLSELENLLKEAHIFAQSLKNEMKKETPDPAKVECFLNALNGKITAAKDFEFRVEIRKVTE